MIHIVVAYYVDADPSDALELGRFRSLTDARTYADMVRRACPIVRNYLIRTLTQA